MVVADRNGTTTTHSGETLSFRPRSYVERTRDGETILEVELPGFSAEDVQITVEQDRLVIRAEAQERPEGETLIGERKRGAREAVFALSEDLDVEKVDARMKAGILTLRFDRKPERKPRQIKIKRS